QKGQGGILFRHYKPGPVDLPVYAKTGVVEINSGLVLFIIVIIAFIKKFGDVANNDEPMRESPRYDQLKPVFFGQFHRNPFPVIWRALPYIDRHIYDFSLEDADDLGL